MNQSESNTTTRNTNKFTPLFVFVPQKYLTLSNKNQTYQHKSRWKYSMLNMCWDTKSQIFSITKPDKDTTPPIDGQTSVSVLKEDERFNL